MSELILIAGANGRTGRAILRALQSSGRSARALIRDPAQWPNLHLLGAAEFAVGDMLDGESVRRAMNGCDTVILIGPPMEPAEVSNAERFIAAGRACGITKFVYYSVMHPLLRSIRHHRLKLDVEQLIVESGLPYVIVQPARYMQHLEPMWRAVSETGVHAMPFSASVLFNVVDLRDVAAATSMLTLSSAFDYGTFELAGPEALSQAAMAKIISDVTGRPVIAQALALDQLAARARTAGASDDRIEQMLAMNRHYDQHGFRGNPTVLEWILGRPLTTYRAYVQRLNAFLLRPKEKP